MFKIVILFIIIAVFSFYLIIPPAIWTQEDEIAQENRTLQLITIPLIYPQKSNAPRRAVKRKKSLATIKGEVFVTVEGLKPKQQNSSTVYVEYFLDGDLVYSSEGKTALGFSLDTRFYLDGRHELIANVWDSAGSSSIGKRKVIIINTNNQ